MGTWLRKARKICGISARELAQRSGYSLNYIQRLESGSRPFTKEALDRISSSLGFSPEEVPLDFDQLEKDAKDLIDETSANNFCLVRFIWRYNKKLIVDLQPFHGEEDDDDAILEHPTLNDLNATPMRLSHVINEITALRNLYDNPLEQEMSRLFPNKTT